MPKRDKQEAMPIPYGIAVKYKRDSPEIIKIMKYKIVE
jgi:hypothetical protein